MHTNFLNELNNEQREVVTWQNEPLLVLAGAGSGKTRVLTTRIAWLISEQGVAPSQVLAVTFTNKAAREMIERLSAMLPAHTRQLWVGTFHGLCHRLLRTHTQEAGLSSNFQILDMQDQQSAIKRLLRNLNISEDSFPPKQVQWFIQHAKEEGFRAKALDPTDSAHRKMIDIYFAYEEQCRKENAIDFGDLLLCAYELLSKHTELLRRYQDRFKHILVDEFQDTNSLQYRWLVLLSGLEREQSKGLFAVGDDDQSIYAFRGAQSAHMQQFITDFKVKKVVKLEQNYRSQGNILKAANALIEQNHHRLGKSLWTDIAQGEPIEVYEALSDYEEAQWVVDTIRFLLAQGRYDIAILYRSNAQSRALEHALFSAGIAYRVYGGLRFFERAEIKHAMAYLRLLINPHDNTSFSRIVNFPPRGIGSRTLELLQEHSALTGQSLWQSIIDVPTRSKNALDGFVELMDSIRQNASSWTLPKLIDHVLSVSGLMSHYRQEKEGHDRVANLEQLVVAADAFLQEYIPDIEAMQADSLSADIFPNLVAFLAHASLEAGDFADQNNPNSVQLMTVHSAKGLEFDTVFITGLEERLFPHENSLLEENGIEEERRLLYVAITRAKKDLYMSFARTRLLHGQTRYSGASRFLKEIPPSVLNINAQAHHTSSVVDTSPWDNRATRQGISSQRNSERRNNDWSPSSKRAPSYSAHASMATKKNVAACTWQIGQRICHHKFGFGVIVNLEGSDTHLTLQINFEEVGVKWLAPDVAKITAC